VGSDTKESDLNGVVELIKGGDGDAEKGEVIVSESKIQDLFGDSEISEGAEAKVGTDESTSLTNGKGIGAVDVKIFSVDDVVCSFELLVTTRIRQ
jgi:hypothetical protein